MERVPHLDALLRHGDFVRRLARSLVADADLAEDVAQETWLAALRRPPRHGDNLRAWLGAVVRNLVRLRRRTDVRRLARERVRARPLAGADPAEVVARLDWERRIVEVVRELEEPYRSTVVHRFLEQMDPAEIARRMGVPRKTVYGRIERALEMLRQRLDRESGSRRAWCLAILPLALDRKAIGAAAATAAGGVAMTKTGVVLAAGLAAASFLAGWSLKPDRAAHVRAPVEAALPTRHDTGSAAPSEPTGTAPSARAAEVDDPTASFVRRVRAASPSWIGVIGIAREIRALPPEEGLAVMRAVFRDVESPEKRRQMLKAFGLYDGHPYSLEILDLGASDPDEGVRDWALIYVSAFAFRDLHADPALYAAWRARSAGRPLRDVVRESAEEFVSRVRPLGGDDLKRELHAFESLWLESEADLGVPDLMRRAGLLDVATSWLDREQLGPGERNIVHGWIRALDPDEAWLRRVYLPALTDPDKSGDTFYAATRALGRERHRWAVEPLVAAYGRVHSLGGYRAISRALLAIGDERAIPAMIATIVADDTQATIEGVGASLSDLVFAEYHPSHDGAWWLAWWERNRQRYPGLALPG